MIRSNPWVIVPRPSRELRLRLFCFPYGGGSASIFRAWPQHLPQEVEVCAIQFPGRGARLEEPPFTRLSPLVQTLSRVLRSYLNVPFAFFGHSLGAFISFELGRQLRKENDRSPLHLFVSGQRAPQLPDLEVGSFSAMLAPVRTVGLMPAPGQDWSFGFLRWAVSRGSGACAPRSLAHSWRKTAGKMLRTR